MPDSYKKRRRRERALRAHLRTCCRLVEEACEKWGVDPREHGHLAIELVRLADPWFFSNRDAPIPAHRHDLARRWLAFRLSGVIDTPTDHGRFARALMPACPEGGPPILRRHGDPDYRSVLEACRSRRRRLDIPEEQPTF
jgi:hypothetical protein